MILKLNLLRKQAKDNKATGYKIKNKLIKDPLKQSLSAPGDGTNKLDSNEIPEHDNAIQISQEDVHKIDNLFNEFKQVY